jgi:hypothetical protein
MARRPVYAHRERFCKVYPSRRNLGEYEAEILPTVGLRGSKDTQNEQEPPDLSAKGLSGHGASIAPQSLHLGYNPGAALDWERYGPARHQALKGPAPDPAQPCCNHAWAATHR